MRHIRVAITNHFKTMALSASGIEFSPASTAFLSIMRTVEKDQDHV